MTLRLLYVLSATCDELVLCFVQKVGVRVIEIRSQAPGKRFMAAPAADIVDLQCLPFC